MCSRGLVRLQRIGQAKMKRLRTTFSKTCTFQEVVRSSQQRKFTRLKKRVAKANWKIFKNSQTLKALLSKRMSLPMIPAARKMTPKRMTEKKEN